MLKNCFQRYQEETEMYLSKDEELKQIQRKLLITSSIDAPGAILMGLGLYGVFGADGGGAAARSDVATHGPAALARGGAGGQGGAQTRSL